MHVICNKNLAFYEIQFYGEMHEKIVLICVLGMVGGDRNLFVRKGSASQKRLGNTAVDDSQLYLPQCIPPRLKPAGLIVHQGKQQINMGSELPLALPHWLQ